MAAEAPRFVAKLFADVVHVKAHSSRIRPRLAKSYLQQLSARDPLLMSLHQVCEDSELPGRQSCMHIVATNGQAFGVEYDICSRHGCRMEASANARQELSLLDGPPNEVAHSRGEELRNIALSLREHRNGGAGVEARVTHLHCFENGQPVPTADEHDQVRGSWMIAKRTGNRVASGKVRQERTQGR